MPAEKNPPKQCPAGQYDNAPRFCLRRRAVRTSARMNADARKVELHARSAMSEAVTIVVAVAIEPLAHDLIAVAFLEAARAAEVLAADLAANPGHRLDEPQLIGCAAQCRRAGGARLTDRRTPKRDGRSRQQNSKSHCMDLPGLSPHPQTRERIVGSQQTSRIAAAPASFPSRMGEPWPTRCIVPVTGRHFLPMRGRENLGRGRP